MSLSAPSHPGVAPAPLNLVAELTYRCPLRCPYCSNPLALRDFPDDLSAADWARVFTEAAALGCVHVGLTGGEPSARPDLEEIVASAEAAGLFTHLVTAGLPIRPGDLAGLRAAGLRSVQVSVQDSDAAASDEIAGTRAFEAKLAFARAVRDEGLPLTLNVVLHRHNLERVPDLIALARQLDADRLELANTQYLGWALQNRAALMPTRDQLATAARHVATAREASPRPEILFVMPDYHRERPKPCMGGWARNHIVVTPDGRALPCHGATALEGLEFWNVRERSLAECWEGAPGMNAFRGVAWMQEPCASCPERERDFGGCRCQAAALLGDPAATDPVCGLSPEHGRIVAAREPASDDAFVYRER